MKRLLILFVAVICLMSEGRAAEVSAGIAADSLQNSSTPWYKQLINTGFHINDPSINYPKFARWCVDLYNWGDRTFNSYDTEYVVATGKNWKAMLKNNNYLESYVLVFPKGETARIHSDLFPDFGAYLCFMAVSVGYTFKVNSILGNASNTRQDFNFNFCCSLFSANFQYMKNDGGTKIRQFGKFEGLNAMKYDFNGLTHKTINANLYYFGNHRKYSQAAAYCFSKYQLKSAGSWIAGLGYTHQNIVMDFSQLPPDMLNQLPQLQPHYMFHYTDYDLLGGYAYNWVLSPRKWLINGTILPSVGLKHSQDTSTDSRKYFFSSNITGMFSVVYNHSDLFASLEGHTNMHLNFGKGYTFVNGLLSFSVIVGARF